MAVAPSGPSTGLQALPATGLAPGRPRPIVPRERQLNPADLGGAAYTGVTDLNENKAVAGNLLLQLPGDQLSSTRMAWGAGASDLIHNLLNDSKHRRGRAEQRLRESGNGAQPQHGMR